MVHFDVNLEQVCHFLRSEKPAAVSANESPLERPKFHWGTDSESSSDTEEDEDPRLGYQRYLDRTQWQIALPNFEPTSSKDGAVVFVENVFLTSDKHTLIGHVAVRNIAFEKTVSIKYTFDNWKTITELTAEYNDDMRRKRRIAGYDRFSFAITMADLPQHASSKSLYFCVKYVCDNQEFWDNNYGDNYQVDFTRVSKKAAALARRLPARQRRSNSADSDLRPHLDGIVDMNDIFGPVPPKDKKPKTQFASRYDFGTSPTSFSRAPRKSSQEGLALNAKSYQELIDSYCFFDGARAAKAPAMPSPTTACPAALEQAQPVPAHQLHVWGKAFGVSV